MVHRHTNNKTIDSGQMKQLNAKDTIQKSSMRLEPLNSVKNQRGNQTLQNRMDTDESEDEVPIDNTDTQRDIPEEESIEKRFFTIEVEFDIQNEVTNDEYSGMVLYTTQVLLQA